MPSGTGTVPVHSTRYYQASFCQTPVSGKLFRKGIHEFTLVLCVQVPSFISQQQTNDEPQQPQQQQQQQPPPQQPPEQESGWSQVLNSNPELRAVVNACERLVVNRRPCLRYNFAHPDSDQEILAGFPFLRKIVMYFAPFITGIQCLPYVREYR